jgi:hypothetical protein
MVPSGTAAHVQRSVTSLYILRSLFARSVRTPFLHLKVNQTISCDKFSRIILFTVSTTDISLVYVAASSLALTSVPDGGGSRSQQHGTNSVLHCVLRELQRESSPTGNASLLRLGFRLVATLSLSSECRGVLWKVRSVNVSFKKLCLM